MRSDPYARFPTRSCRNIAGAQWMGGLKSGDLYDSIMAGLWFIAFYEGNAFYTCEVWFKLATPYAGMLILVLVLKDSLRTFFKSLSLS